MLPRLLERSGQAALGAITAVYTVLVEGDDLSEPIADEVRGLLDGHIILDRELAARGHYPAIDVLRSLSRVMGEVTSEAHQQAARTLRELLAAHESKRDLIALGAYVRGKDPLTDRALGAMPEILRLLRQEGRDVIRFEETTERLQKLAAY
jgi:flagellar biosynthesis/type III secretory pathway ATPase